ncbi:MAG: hypothetical protein E7048_00415 [Lentisphaerae bacterium]|nr:hypothetical protein [Lentisphaerota bacterium]
MHDSGRILRGAAALIEAVTSNKAVLDEEMEKIDPAYRRSIGHLVLTFFRRRKAVDALLQQRIQRPPLPAVQALLQSVVTQVFFQRAIAAQSAVNIAVTEAKRYKADKFVNAVLRRIIAAGAEFGNTPQEVFPEQILKKWKHRPELSRLADAFLKGADFTFRLEKEWELEGVQAEAVSSPAFRFFKGNAAEVLNSVPFKENHIYIQDPATSLIFQDLDLSGVHKALDVCAAPGGKTLMLAELLPVTARIVAADRSRNRQKLTRQNLESRGIKADVIVALPEELAGSYDLVLADVPCSNTGVFRRRPDALWNFSAAKMEELVKIQREIMESVCARVAPGGLLIYSTCSIEPEENVLQVSDFLEKHPELSLVSQRQLIPDLETDGAFAAVMRKKK